MRKTLKYWVNVRSVRFLFALSHFCPKCSKWACKRLKPRSPYTYMRNALKRSTGRILSLQGFLCFGGLSNGLYYAKICKKYPLWRSYNLIDGNQRGGENRGKNMFINLIRLLCAYGNTKTYILGRELGYKTPSAFQSVISKNDLRLGVLQAICGALGFSIVILDEQGRTVANVSDYIQRQTEQPPEH